MTSKTKIGVIVGSSTALFVYWLVLALTHTRFKEVNYWWEAALSVEFIAFGIVSMFIAKKWSSFKSSMGSGIMFIALGLIAWGIAQAGWTYYVIKDPNQQNPNYMSLNVTYFLSIPLWFLGTFRLSKATGAKYGLKSAKAKAGVAALILVMFAVSYYLLVTVARGGTKYFNGNTFSGVFFDLGYAAGDVINLTLALGIFGLSWKYLGGKFKRPILLVLLAFAAIYLADLVYAYYQGKGEYYNGQWDDLLYLATGAIFGVGLCMLDPGSKHNAVIRAEQSKPKLGSSGAPSLPQSTGGT